MIDRMLYGVTALALASVFLFDGTFAENLSRALDGAELSSVASWELMVGGVLLGMAIIAVYRELVK